MSAVEDIRSRVIELVAEQAGKPAEQIVPDHSFVNDLDFDSLEKVELAMGIEDEFEMSVGDDEADDLKTVGDVIALVTKHKNAA